MSALSWPVWVVSSKRPSLAEVYLSFFSFSNLSKKAVQLLLVLSKFIVQDTFTFCLSLSRSLFLAHFLVQSQSSDFSLKREKTIVAFWFIVLDLSYESTTEPFFSFLVPSLLFCSFDLSLSSKDHLITGDLGDLTWNLKIETGVSERNWSHLFQNNENFRTNQSGLHGPVCVYLFNGCCVGETFTW